MSLSPERILETGFAFWTSKVLLTAVELNLFTELAKQPGTADELRARFGWHERGTRDFLDALVSMKFLDRSADGVYRNTAETELFLDRNKPTYIGGILEMASARLFRFWQDLPEALRTGQLQNEAKHGGEHFFAALYADPQRLRQFLRAMSGLSRGANLGIAQKVPWRQYQSVADVGTAQGDLVVQIVKANPHLRGIGFDLPVAGDCFKEYVAEHGLTDRVAFVAGDFFADELPRADVITMGHILHDWGLDQKRELIRKAYDALPPGGAFVAYDSIIDDDRRSNTFGLLMSLNMLIETESGFDYTGADCCRWLTDAGFRETRVEHLVGPDSMVIGIK